MVGQVMSISMSNYQAEGISLSGLRSWRVVFQEDVETGVTCKANVPGDDVVGPIRGVHLCETVLNTVLGEEIALLGE